MINNLSIKRVDQDFAKYFPEYASLPQSTQDLISLEKISSMKYLPVFIIKDVTRTRPAAWMAGRKQEYLEDQQTFGFNRDSYVAIPEIYLKYRHDEKGRWLSLKGLFNSGPQRKKKVKKLLSEKIKKTRATAP